MSGSSRVATTPCILLRGIFIRCEAVLQEWLLLVPAPFTKYLNTLISSCQIVYVLHMLTRVSLLRCPQPPSIRTAPTTTSSSSDPVWSSGTRVPGVTAALPRAAGPPPTTPSSSGSSSQLPLVLGLTLGLGGGLLVLGLLAALAAHRGLLRSRGGGWGAGGGRKRGFEKFEEGSAAAAAVAAGETGGGGGGGGGASPSVSRIHRVCGPPRLAELGSALVKMHECHAMMCYRQWQHMFKCCEEQSISETMPALIASWYAAKGCCLAAGASIMQHYVSICCS
jgi:hypothetical protein